MNIVLILKKYFNKLKKKIKDTRDYNDRNINIINKL